MESPKNASDFHFYTKYLIINAWIEIFFDRFIYRVGTSLPLGIFYQIFDFIGNISRILMVFMLFGYLIWLIKLTQNNRGIMYIIAIQTVSFSVFYLYALFGYPMSFELDLINKLFMMLSIQFFLIFVQRRSYSESKAYIPILLLLQIILGLGFIYVIGFLINSSISLNMSIFIIVSNFAQILSIAGLCWTIFFVAVYYIKKEKFQSSQLFLRKKQYLPFLSILGAMIIVLSLLNFGPVIRTEEHTITFFDIYSWTIVFVLGFTNAFISEAFVNFTIFSFSAGLIGILLLRKIGNYLSNSSITHLAFGLFLLFCGAFMFLEAFDSYFILETYCGVILILEPWIIVNERDYNQKVT